MIPRSFIREKKGRARLGLVNSLSGLSSTLLFCKCNGGFLFGSQKGYTVVTTEHSTEHFQQTAYNLPRRRLVGSQIGWSLDEPDAVHVAGMGLYAEIMSSVVTHFSSINFVASSLTPPPLPPFPSHLLVRTNHVAQIHDNAIGADTSQGSQK